MPKLTDLAVRTAKPRATAYKLAGERGLCVLIQPDGKRFWRLRYTFAGKEKMLSLGAYPQVTLKAAEAAADAARARLLAGVNPSEERRQAKLALRLGAERTFALAARLWLEHNTPRWKPATVEKVRQYLDKDLLPPLGVRPLAAISPLELSAVVERIEARAAFNVAKKSRQWLVAIFAHALARGLMTGDNPAAHLGAIAIAAPRAQRYPHLTVERLPDFLQALARARTSILVRGAIWLGLWTANRPGVTRTLRWAELDLDGALWTIERDRELMKGGYRHLTPLPTQAVALLREIHRLTGTFEHVFIGRNNPRVPMSDGAVNGALKRMGYGGEQTAHGFRHLVSTALNETGDYTPDWIERQLAHGDPDEIRGTYNLAHYLAPRRAMMQAWADRLERLQATPPR